jgi:hypothetical protein
VKLARSGSVPGTVLAASVIAAQGLVGDQEGPDLLVHAIRGAGRAGRGRRGSWT